MMKNIVKLECKVGDKVGQFLLDNDTPIQVAKEMLFQFMKHVGHIEDAAKDKQNVPVSDEVKEEPKPE